MQVLQFRGNISCWTKLNVSEWFMIKERHEMIVEASTGKYINKKINKTKYNT